MSIYIHSAVSVGSSCLVCCNSVVSVGVACLLGHVHRMTYDVWRRSKTEKGTEIY